VWAPTGHLDALAKTNLLSLQGSGLQFLGSLACNLDTVPIIVPDIERKRIACNFKARRKKVLYTTQHKESSKEIPPWEVSEIKVQ
jgi:hypothetical protein